MKKYYKIGIESKSWLKSAYEAVHKREGTPLMESLFLHFNKVKENLTFSQKDSFFFLSLAIAPFYPGMIWNNILLNLYLFNIFKKSERNKEDFPSYFLGNSV